MTRQAGQHVECCMLRATFVEWLKHILTAYAACWRGCCSLDWVYFTQLTRTSSVTSPRLRGRCVCEQWYVVCRKVDLWRVISEHRNRLGTKAAGTIYFYMYRCTLPWTLYIYIDGNFDGNLRKVETLTRLLPFPLPPPKPPSTTTSTSSSQTATTTTKVLPSPSRRWSLHIIF